MLQNLLETSVIQKYPLGYRYAIDDRVFRYAHVDIERQARPFYGVFPKITYSETHAPSVLAKAGAKVIVGVAVAAIAKDAYKDGYCGVEGGIASRGCYKVKGNDAAVAPGATFNIYLQDALVGDVAVATETYRLYQSMYANVVCMRQRQVDGVATDWRKVSAIGFPQLLIPAGRYAWIQTWGPGIVVGDSGTEGIADSERQMQLGDNLDMLRLRDLGDGLGRHQLGGFVLPVTTAGAGNELYFIQISP